MDKNKREQITKKVLEITRNWSGINSVNEGARFVDVVATGRSMDDFWKEIKGAFGTDQGKFSAYVLRGTIKGFASISDLIDHIIESGELKAEPTNNELCREEVSAEVLEIMNDILRVNVPGMCEDDSLPSSSIMISFIPEWNNLWVTLRRRFRVVFSEKAIKNSFRKIKDIVDYVMENGDLSRNTDEKCEAELLTFRVPCSNRITSMDEKNGVEDEGEKVVTCRGRNGWFNFCDVDVVVTEKTTWVDIWSKRKGDNPPIAITGPPEMVLNIFENIVLKIKDQMGRGDK